MSDEKQYEIVYFKPSGKYYTSEKVTWPKDAPDHSGWNPISTFHRIGEMYAVCMNAPHGFPQFSPPKTVYDLQQTIHELRQEIEKLKVELVQKDASEVLGFAEGFEEATEAGEKVLSQALDSFKTADAAVLRGVQSSGRNATPDGPYPTGSLGCTGTPGAASWGRCEKEQGHEPPCTHDPSPRVAPGEKLKLQDPRFGTPEHMQARWKNSGLRGPFFIQSSNHGPCVIRECNGQKVVTECQTREIASAIVDALDAYDGGKKP